MTKETVSDIATKIMAAADALGAPYFDADRFKAAAMILESQLSDDFFDSLENDGPTQRELTILRTGLAAAFARICMPYLPREIPECFDETHEAMMAAIQVCNKYVPKK